MTGAPLDFGHMPGTLIGAVERVIAWLRRRRDGQLLAARTSGRCATSASIEPRPTARCHSGVCGEPVTKREARAGIFRDSGAPRRAGRGWPGRGPAMTTVVHAPSLQSPPFVMAGLVPAIHDLLFLFMFFEALGRGEAPSRPRLRWPLGKRFHFRKSGVSLDLFTTSPPSARLRTSPSRRCGSRASFPPPSRPRRSSSRRAPARRELQYFCGT